MKILPFILSILITFSSYGQFCCCLSSSQGDFDCNVPLAEACLFCTAEDSVNTNSNTQLKRCTEFVQVWTDGTNYYNDDLTLKNLEGIYTKEVDCNANCLTTFTLWDDYGLADIWRIIDCDDNVIASFRGGEELESDLNALGISFTYELTPKGTGLYPDGQYIFFIEGQCIKALQSLNSRTGEYSSFNHLKPVRRYNCNCACEIQSRRNPDICPPDIPNESEYIPSPTNPCDQR